MFREYQRLGSDSGSGSRIRTISGASRDSELLGRANGEILESAPGEEMAPSTVIELCVDEPSSVATRAESEGGDGERVSDKGKDDETEEGRGHAAVAVSNILLRAEEEEKQEEERRAQQQDNQAGSQCEAEAPDEAPCDNHVDAAMEGNDAEPEPKEKPTVPGEGAEGGDPQKSEETGAEGKAAEASESLKEEAKVEGTNDVKQPAGEGDVPKEGELTEENRDQHKDPESGEPAKESGVVLSREDSAEQGNSEVSNYQETSTAGASILNEDLVDVSSVSDAVRASDDSMEESSFVSASAPTGEDDEDGDDEDEDAAQRKVAESASGQPDGSAESSPTEGQEEVKEGSEKSADQEGEEKAMVDSKEAQPATGTTKEPVVDPIPSEEPTAEPVVSEEPTDPVTSGGTTAEPVASEEPTADPVASGGSTAEAQTSKEEKGDPSPAKNEEGEASDSQKPAAAPGKEQAQGTAAKTKEIKIARLDVSSVATDTERLELKEASTSVWQD